jgi:sugar phosphate isomerase/epimerase
MDTPHRITRRGFLERSLKTAAVGIAAPHAAASGVTPAASRATPAAPGVTPAASGAAVTTLPAKAAEWQIGCYTRPWAEHDWRVALDAIAEAGFKHAGLMSTKSKTRLVISAATDIEEAGRVGEEARKRGLEIPSVYGGGFPVDQSLQAGVDGLRRLIDNCAAAGAKTLLLGGTGDRKLYRRYYKAVAEICDYAAAKRVGIVLKPHGGLNATGPQCRKTLGLVQHGNFTLWYDPGNIYYYSNGQLDPVEDAQTVDGIVTGMCIKDFTMSTKDGKVTRDVLVDPGDGKVDFPAVLARLKKGGFTRGPMVIETLARGNLSTLLVAAKKARLFVRALVA